MLQVIFDFTGVVMFCSVCLEVLMHEGWQWQRPADGGVVFAGRWRLRHEDPARP